MSDERAAAIRTLRQVVADNAPSELREVMLYGMITYVVPHEAYPPGYHVNRSVPLPYLALASQKSHVAIYALGIYMMPEVLQWFKGEYDGRVSGKLDMGKSCIRFRNVQKIPYELIGELCRKMDLGQFIEAYERATSKK